jgi:hypothetical protein
LLDRQSRESDDLVVHMHALEDRAGGVPVRCFAWPSGRLADVTSSSAGYCPVRQRVGCPRGLSLGWECEMTLVAPDPRVVAHYRKHARAADGCALGSDRDVLRAVAPFAGGSDHARRCAQAVGTDRDCCSTHVTRQLRADGSIGSLVLVR